MNIVILGAGIAGITTAYMLAKKGFNITIIDKHTLPGKETSYANGGQLSYSYKTPIASPAIFKQLPKITLGLDPAFKIQPTFDHNFYRWGLRFLLQCTAENSQHSSKLMQKIGNLAQKELTTIINDTQLNFNFRKSSGKLYVYQNKKIFEDIKRQYANTNDSGLWDQSKLHSQIPALKNNQHTIGALFDHQEDVGDCHQFCTQLMQYLQEQYNVVFLNNHKILNINTHKARSNTSPSYIDSIQTDKGNIKGDAYIMTMGIHSVKLAKTIGINLPIYPMKGYSVTVPATSFCPDISITDTDKKTVYCRLGDRLRIAGFAEFSGMNKNIDQTRIKQLLDNARNFLPLAGDYETIENAWCGLRPSTPDSLPIVGKTSFNNLYMNTGHGMLGWTHSAATAKLIANLLSKTSQPFDIESLSINRFS